MSLTKACSRFTNSVVEREAKFEQGAGVNTGIGNFPQPRPWRRSAGNDNSGLRRGVLMGIALGYYPARKAAYLDPTGVVRFELLGVCVLGSWVIGTSMQGKLFVALQLEVAHHFIERCAGDRARSFEPPATLGATKTPKTRLLNPYQLPAHGLLCRCAPTLSDRIPSTRLPSRDETFSSSPRRTA